MSWVIEQRQQAGAHMEMPPILTFMALEGREEKVEKRGQYQVLEIMGERYRGLGNQEKVCRER